MLRIVLLLLVVAGFAGYFTRPQEPAMRDAADAVLRDINSGGDLVDAAQALIVGDRQFSDYYVVTKYVVSAGDTALVNCWGAFTQTQCSRVRTTEAAQ
jgi:hypothetical protein